jgi:hypothetical protein
MLNSQYYEIFGFETKQETEHQILPDVPEVVNEDFFIMLENGLSSQKLAKRASHLDDHFPCGMTAECCLCQRFFKTKLDLDAHFAAEPTLHKTLGAL